MATEISVIMSVYNTEEEYLKKSIESILNQTFSDYEFIIVADCPTDNSTQIIKSYAAKDSRIVVIENKMNLGLTKSLNLALKKAKGKYIARMDCDDVAVPNRFQIQYDFLEKHPSVGVVGGHVYTGKKGTRAMTAWNKNSEVTRIQMLFHNAGVPHPTAMFRRKLQDGTQVRYNEEILKGQDYALWTQIINKTNIVVLDKILLLYRIHDNQISAIPEGQYKYSKIVIKKQLNSLLGIIDDNIVNAIASIYFENEQKNSLKTIKNVLNIISNQNVKKDIFNSKILKKTLKKIEIEYFYNKEKKSRNTIKLICKIIKKYGLRNFMSFTNYYFYPRIRHDILVFIFKIQKKNFISNALENDVK